MAFWKKSDDPWDRKPEKRQETTWYEQDAPPAEEKRELTPEEQRIRNIIEGPKATPVTPEQCPWCGKDMEMVSVYSRGGTVCWRKGEPGRWVDDDQVLQDPVDSIWDIPRKRAWYCESCGKMTLAVPKPKTMLNDPNSFADYARQWKEMEEREKEEARRKKRGE